MAPGSNFGNGVLFWLINTGTIRGKLKLISAQVRRGWILLVSTSLSWGGSGQYQAHEASPKKGSGRRAWFYPNLTLNCVYMSNPVATRARGYILSHLLLFHVSFCVFLLILVYWWPIQAVLYVTNLDLTRCPDLLPLFLD